MENTRLNKLSRLIQKDLSEIFQKESKTLFDNTIITVTKVRITSDLSLARVYLSLFTHINHDEVLQQIKLNSGLIKNELSHRIKNQVRKIPALEFFLDDSLDYIENIEKLLK